MRRRLRQHAIGRMKAIDAGAIDRCLTWRERRTFIFWHAVVHRTSR